MTVTTPLRLSLFAGPTVAELREMEERAERIARATLAYRRPAWHPKALTPNAPPGGVRPTRQGKRDEDAPDVLRMLYEDNKEEW